MNAPVLGFDTEADPAARRPYGPAALRRVEAAPKAFRRLWAKPRYEIASPTYSHLMMKSIRGLTPRPVPEIERDLRRGIEVRREVFDVKRVEGLCAPGNFYRGLHGRPRAWRPDSRAVHPAVLVSEGPAAGNSPHGLALQRAQQPDERAHAVAASAFRPVEAEVAGASGQSVKTRGSGAL
jgi:hypothetical protein